MERKIIDFTVGDLVDLKKHEIDLEHYRVVRLWTLYDEKQIYENAPFNPFTGQKVTSINDAHLEHLQGVFLEDVVHDWRIIQNNLLKYYSRVVGLGEKIKVILELEKC